MTPSSLTLQAFDPAAQMELFAAICNETATVSQFQAFEDLLRQDERARDEFSRFVQMQVLLQRKFAVGRFPADIADPAAVAPSPSTGFLAAPLRGAFGYFTQEVPLSYFIGTVLTAMLLLIASLVQVSNEQVQIAKRSSSLPTAIATPKTNAVGYITGLFNCKGQKKAAKSGHASEINGSRLQKTNSLVALGDKFALSAGLLEITYDSGARVILQSPVTYEVNSRDGGFLSCGKLTARLEKTPGKVASGQWSVVNESCAKSQNPEIFKSPNSNPQSLIPNLFVIHTPSAVVTDLGTEFGVEVTKEGATTSHVFRGLVRVQTVSDHGNPEGDGQVLRENQSARVEKNSPKHGNSHRIVVLTGPLNATDFVREIPRQETPKPVIKAFDLVDVVAGGDGFSGRRNAGIDAATGLFGNVAPDDRPSSFGDGKYHRVRGMSFIDGVFIPKGGDVEVQVDSVGHVFADCPKTSNATAHHVWAGGAIPTRGTPISTILGGVDYAAKGRGLLFLHPNKGITFDLEAIRKANSDYVIQRFRSVAGISEQTDERNQGFADIWVLIDGQLRFRRWQINAASGAFTLDIPIKQNERFLTLVSTDAGNDIASDWVVFGDPRLELQSAKSPVGLSVSKSETAGKGGGVIGNGGN